MADSDSVRALVRAFCADIGRDRLLVQGAGGNVSWKDGDVLWVKASGCWLAEADQREIFVPVALNELREAIQAGNFDFAPKAMEGGSGLKPSIETMLHALMPHKVVVHLHAVEVLAHLVREEGLQGIARALGDVVSWRAVPYRKPGGELARSIAEALGQDSDIDVVFMVNHGLVIGGESTADVAAKLALLVGRLALPANFAAPRQVADESLSQAGYARVDDVAVQSLAFEPQWFDRLPRDWALYPDHVVFLGARPFVYESTDDLLQLCKTADPAPELAFVRGNGVYARASFNKAKVEQIKCYADVLVRQQPADRLQSLSQQDIGEVLNWDAERYRQELNRGSQSVAR